MRFGPVPLDEAEGAILAHSMKGEGWAIRKGTALDAETLGTLRRAGLDAVLAARPGGTDVAEDEAAAALARAACGDGLTLATAFTGRCNLRAEADGLLVVEAAAVDAANAVDEALTLATARTLARLAEGQLAATAKVIPYAAPRAALEAACAALRSAPLRLAPFRSMEAALILTRTSGQRDGTLAKGAEAVEARLHGLGCTLRAPEAVAHETAALADALRRMEAELVLVLGGSATSDRADVVPAAIEAAGGTVERFGMPVDPGNLLVLGRLRGAPVVGLPGCARSPALNGADWVLERLVAGVGVTGPDIARMGVGGLLKEITSRPQPRERR